jgi:hypothetical protein
MCSQTEFLHMKRFMNILYNGLSSIQKKCPKYFSFYVIRWGKKRTCLEEKLEHLRILFDKFLLINNCFLMNDEIIRIYIMIYNMKYSKRRLCNNIRKILEIINDFLCNMDTNFIVIRSCNDSKFEEYYFHLVIAFSFDFSF